MGEINDLRREIKLEEPDREVEAVRNVKLERRHARVAVPNLYR